MESSTDSRRRSLVLLTGATGYIGGRLLKGLEKAGWTVRCLARHPEFLRPRVAPNTEVVKGDCLDPASLPAALRDPLKFRRCLIPADGFYEWRRTSIGKQPFCFEVENGELFAFAGPWDGWKNAEGRRVRTCTILTTTPNALTGTVHDRMPVILHKDDYDVWLDPGMQNAAAIAELLKPYDARLMRCYPVSTRINHVANDHEECSRPLEIAESQSSLFC